MKKLAIFLLQLLLPYSVFAANFYVTQSGAGSGNGSSTGNAWSLSAFNSSKTPTAGDTVFFSGTLTGYVSPSCNGSASNHVILDFTGSTFDTNDQGGPNGLISFNQGQSTGITINGATYTGGANTTVDFISVGSGNYCSYLTVQNCHLDNMCHFWTGNTTYNHDVLLLNNWFRTSANTVQQTDVISTGDAYNVTIQGNFLCNRAPGNGTQPAGNARHNDIIQSFQSGATPNAAPANWIICFNWIECDANGDGNNSWTMTENVGGNPALTIYDNVFVCTTSSPNNGVTVDSNDPNCVCYFYNNTCIANPGPNNIVRFLAPGILYSRNNVIQSQAGYSGTAADWEMTAGATWDYNFVYSPGAMNSGDQGPHGSTTANPTLAANYSPQAGSPLIGAGTNLGAPYNVGISPNATWPNPTLVTRAGAWDVGAFQSGLSPSQVQNFRQVSN